MRSHCLCLLPVQLELFCATVEGAIWAFHADSGEVLPRFPIYANSGIKAPLTITSMKPHLPHWHGRVELETVPPQGIHRRRPGDAAPHAAVGGTGDDAAAAEEADYQPVVVAATMDGNIHFIGLSSSQASNGESELDEVIQRPRTRESLSTLRNRKPGDTSSNGQHNLHRPRPGQGSGGANETRVSCWQTLDLGERVYVHTAVDNPGIKYCRR